MTSLFPAFGGEVLLDFRRAWPACFSGSRFSHNLGPSALGVSLVGCGRRAFLTSLLPTFWGEVCLISSESGGVCSRGCSSQPWLRALGVSLAGCGGGAFLTSLFLAFGGGVCLILNGLGERARVAAFRGRASRTTLAQARWGLRWPCGEGGALFDLFVRAGGCLAGQASAIGRHRLAPLLLTVQARSPFGRVCLDEGGVFVDGQGGAPFPTLGDGWAPLLTRSAFSVEGACS